MITHDEAQTLLSVRQDQRLDPLTEQELMTHISHCATCRAFAESTQALTNGLATMPRIPASSRVRQSVLAEIDRGRTPWVRAVGAWEPPVGRALATAALVVLLIVGGFFAYDRLGGSFWGDDDTRTQLASQPTEVVLPTPTLMPSPEPTATDEPTPEPTSTPEPTATDEPTPEPTNTPEPTATDEPTPAPTSTPEPTVTDEPTPEPTNTPEPTVTDEPTPEPTNTPEPTATDEPTPEPTSTPEPTATDEPTPEPTSTPEPTATDEPTVEPTSTPEPTATDEPTVEPTSTPEPTATDEPTPEPTSTPEPTATAEPTPEPTSTPEPTATEEPTATTRPLIEPIDPTESPIADEPTATDEPTGTPEPTATDEPSPEPTGTPEPTATDEPSPEPTGTPEPTATTPPLIEPIETPESPVADEPTAPADPTSIAGPGLIEPINATDAVTEPTPTLSGTDNQVRRRRSDTRNDGNRQTDAVEVSLADVVVPYQYQGLAGEGSRLSVEGGILKFVDEANLAPLVTADGVELGTSNVLGHAAISACVSGSCVPTEASDTAGSDTPLAVIGQTGYFLRTNGDTLSFRTVDLSSGTPTNDTELVSMGPGAAPAGAALTNGELVMIPTQDGGWMQLTNGSARYLAGAGGSPQLVRLTGDQLAWVSDGSLMVSPVSAPEAPSAVVPFNGRDYDTAPGGRSMIAIVSGDGIDIVGFDGQVVTHFAAGEISPGAISWLQSGLVVIDENSGTIYQIPAEQLVAP